VLQYNDTESGARGGLFGAGGRFKGGTDSIMKKCNESISFDKRMWDQDIRGSLAYAKALSLSGIISEDESQQLLKVLELVQEEWWSSTFEIKPGDEDIHTANERRLTELIGPMVGKLHTRRSRNDQFFIAIDVVGEVGLEIDFRVLIDVRWYANYEKHNIFLSSSPTDDDAQTTINTLQKRTLASGEMIREVDSDYQERFTRVIVIAWSRVR